MDPLARLHQRGFSLVEALVALTIFAFVMAGLTTLMFSTTGTNSQARRMTAATVLAQAKLEELGASTSSLTTGTYQDSNNPLTESGTSAGIYRRSWQIQAGPTAGSQAIKVTVNWTDKQGDHAVSLPTIVSQ